MMYITCRWVADTNEPDRAAEPGLIGLRPRRSLTDLLWVVNTRHGPGGHWFARVTEDVADHDHLANGANAMRYLVDHHVDLPAEPPTAADLRGP